MPAPRLAIPPQLSEFDVNVTPPRYCDSLEELVVDGGIKPLGLRLCATCKELSAAHFDSIYFRSFHYYVGQAV